MAMPPGLRRIALAIHVTLSIGWIGAVVGYLTLGAVAATSESAQTIRAAWIAMEVIGWLAIVPLAITSLATGLVMALGTKWGLFGHYWVIFSLALTLFAVTILLLHMPMVSSTADIARQGDFATLSDLGGDLAHPSIGLAVLLVTQFLNFYKPPGLTRYGQRKERGHRGAVST